LTWKVKTRPVVVEVLGVHSKTTPNSKDFTAKAQYMHVLEASDTGWNMLGAFGTSGSVDDAAQTTVNTFTV
jgi:hypothetical protein